MYEFDLSTLSGVLASLWALMRGALVLDPNAYAAALTQDGGGRLSLAVLFVAGLSITLGRSVVLFANRVSRRRFVVSLVLSSLLLLAGVLFWAVTVWLLATYLFGAQQTVRNLFIVVSLSYAPLAYGIFVLLPYLGNIVDVLLRIWILISLVVAVMVVFPLSLVPALICCLLGWVFLELVSRFSLVMAIEARLWRLVSGAPYLLPTEEVVESFVQDFRADSRPFAADEANADEG